ncbi:MAG: hypothetical protein A2W28_02975 [Gammaproteobacteria bacterium RBG_16_51_14]|nr:MAG: hypothetical protein A2W28_02975 [Gammaproteobacteria bacterium RBG_16_51_14]
MHYFSTTRLEADTNTGLPERRDCFAMISFPFPMAAYPSGKNILISIQTDSSYYLQGPQAGSPVSDSPIKNSRFYVYSKHRILERKLW